MDQATRQSSLMLDEPPRVATTERARGLTTTEWVICGVAALGFAFDLYEMLVMPIVLRPALSALGGLESESREFNRWVGLMF